MIEVSTVVNGVERVLTLEGNELLLDVLRETLHLTGTKRSCDVEVCGACTVLLDGAAVSACTTLAAEMHDRAVTTIEGLADGDELHPMQRAFVEHGASQCGYCTPGMIMSACALLNDHPGADEPAVRDYLAGTICRCTGYAKIVEAVTDVLRTESGERG